MANSNLQGDPAGGAATRSAHIPTAALLSVDVRETDDRLTVSLTGEIDVSTSRQLSSAVLGAMPEDNRPIVLDLRDVTFMDSSGIHTLLRLRTAAARRRNRLVVVRGPRPIQRVLELTSTEELFEMVDEPSEIAARTDPV